jgi:hypothetical protein
LALAYCQNVQEKDIQISILKETRYKWKKL